MRSLVLAVTSGRYRDAVVALEDSADDCGTDGDFLIQMVFRALDIDLIIDDGHDEPTPEERSELDALGSSNA